MMKECEDLKIIYNRIIKHPDYDREMKNYYQKALVNDYYARATDRYYPGQSSVPREERDIYYKTITRYSNMPVFCIELMKSLLTEEERKNDHQTCIKLLRRSIDILKEQLSTCKGMDRICFAHDIFCRLKIPYANLKEYDPDGFLDKLLAVQIKKMKNMKKQQIRDGLREYYYRVINRLDANVFAEDEILPAAIILDAYFNNDMQGMKNARYFSTVVANELDELVDDSAIAEIVRKLISHDHINGEIDGKYHFLLHS
jgi:hypothetical protein